MSDQIKWWPEYLADEVMPEGKASPSDWIVGRDSGAGWHIATMEDDSWPTRDVTLGEVVNFVSCQHHAYIRVIWRTDGKHEVLGQAPTSATHFMIDGDIDTLSYSLEDLLQLDDLAADGDEIEIACAEWSEPIPHRLVIENNKPRFVPLEALSHDPAWARA